MQKLFTYPVANASASLHQVTNLKVMGNELAIFPCLKLVKTASRSIFLGFDY